RTLELSDRDLLMQEIAHRAVEVRAVRAVEHHREVTAVLPVALARELVLHELVELRAGQRIGDADADVIGTRGLEQLARGEDVGELLVQVAELDEDPHADALRPKALACAEDLPDRGALVHGVENALTAALRADPGLGASGLAQCLRHGLAGEVRADLN